MVIRMGRLQGCFWCVVLEKVVFAARAGLGVLVRRKKHREIQ
jgi:hypothetical protein